MSQNQSNSFQAVVARLMNAGCQATPTLIVASSPTINQVEYRFNYDTAAPNGDWLGVVAWGEEPAAGTCIVRKNFLGTSAGTVCCDG